MPPRPIGPTLTLVHPETASGFYRDGLWRRDTFPSLIDDHAAARPDAYAIRDSGRRLTWAAFQAMIDRIAGHLTAAGVAPGERVSLRLSNRVEGVATLIAAAKIGALSRPRAA